MVMMRVKARVVGYRLQTHKEKVKEGGEGDGGDIAGNKATCDKEKHKKYKTKTVYQGVQNKTVYCE